MRYSRQPYEKAVDDLAKAMSGQGLQPPAPSAIPIAEYYHAAELEIEQLLELEKDQQERYRLILEHQKEIHRHIKHQTDGERMLQDEVDRGMMTARGGSGRASALNSARLPPVTAIGDKPKGSPMLPPLFSNRLPPKEEEKANLFRSLNSFLPSLLVPTCEEPNFGIQTTGGGIPSRSPRAGQSPRTAQAQGLTDPSNKGGKGAPGLSATSPTPGQARLRHRSVKDQRLALLSQMTDPATGERVRVVENPYRRHREEREEAERRKHLQPHTTALLTALSFDDASKVTDPFYVLKETQDMLKGKRQGGGGGGACTRKGWTRESLLLGDNQALAMAPDELAEHLKNRLVSSAPTMPLPQIRVTPRQLLTPIRQGASTTSASSVGGLNSPTMLGLNESMSLNSTEPLLQMSLTMRPNSQSAHIPQDSEAEERRRAALDRKAAIKLWHASKQDQLHQQERFSIDEKVAQRNYHTVLNQRTKSIEVRMEAVQDRAIAAEEARGQELLRQAESRSKSNALEMLRGMEIEEEVTRQRIEAEENLAKNKYIILSFEAELHRLGPSVPLLPSPAAGALPIDDTVEVDLMSLKNNNTAGGSEGRWEDDGNEGEPNADSPPRQLRLPGMTNGRLALTTFVIGDSDDAFGIGRKKKEVVPLDSSVEGLFVKVPSMDVDDDDDALLPMSGILSPPPRTLPLLKSPDGKNLGSPRNGKEGNNTPSNGASPRSSHSSPRNVANRLVRSEGGTGSGKELTKPEKIQYAKLKPIDEDAPEPVKSWVTPFFNAPTPALTMRAIAGSLGLMEPIPPEAEGGQDTAGSSHSHPFQRVASLYASNSNIGGSISPRPRAGVARRREKAQPLGFLGL